MISELRSTISIAMITVKFSWTCHFEVHRTPHMFSWISQKLFLQVVTFVRLGHIFRKFWPELCACLINRLLAFLVELLLHLKHKWINLFKHPNCKLSPLLVKLVVSDAFVSEIMDILIVQFLPPDYCQKCHKQKFRTSPTETDLKVSNSNWKANRLQHENTEVFCWKWETGNSF